MSNNPNRAITTGDRERNGERPRSKVKATDKQVALLKSFNVDPSLFPTRSEARDALHLLIKKPSS